MTDRVVIHAPTKVNLHLHVLPGVWAGGYHTLETILVALDLTDEVEVERTASGIEIQVVGGRAPQGSENLAFRAAQRFFEHFGVAGGARISLRKRIPSRAGLGGGSADAAAVLLALRALCQAQRTDRDLERLAAGLGADVPFFIRGGLQRAVGLGDVLERLEVPSDQFWVVLAQGRHSLSTAAVYKAFDSIPPQSPTVTFAEACHLVEDGQWEAVLYNSLEAAARWLCPEVGDVSERLRECGATAVLLSGSGSAVFALERSAKAAHAIADAMKAYAPWVTVCRPFLGPIKPMTHDGLVRRSFSEGG